jgi:hypothetical protein
MDIGSSELCSFGVGVSSFPARFILPMTMPISMVREIWLSEMLADKRQRS